tara:strand:+ start:1032 stop:1589 length:558 start_codon:yes stop_codon:yes gene_type:complete
MNTPDILFSIILLIFTINGFRRGLIKEIARLAGLFISCFIASKYYIELIPLIENYFINVKVIEIISFLIIFFISIIIINIVSLSIQKFFEIIYLGWLNKLLGSLLGFIKGLIVVSIIILCMDVLPTETIKKIEKQSSIYKVGKNIQEKIFVGTANYDSNSLIDLNKITKDFESIEIPSLDSLIKK